MQLRIRADAPSILAIPEVYGDESSAQRLYALEIAIDNYISVIETGVFSSSTDRDIFRAILKRDGKCLLDVAAPQLPTQAM